MLATAMEPVTPEICAMLIKKTLAMSGMHTTISMFIPIIEMFQ